MASLHLFSIIRHATPYFLECQSELGSKQGYFGERGEKGVVKPMQLPPHHYTHTANNAHFNAYTARFQVSNLGLIPIRLMNA